MLHWAPVIATSYKPYWQNATFLNDWCSPCLCWKKSMNLVSFNRQLAKRWDPVLCVHLFIVLFEQLEDHLCLGSRMWCEELALKPGAGYGQIWSPGSLDLESSHWTVSLSKEWFTTKLLSLLGGTDSEKTAQKVYAARATEGDKEGARSGEGR